MRKKIKQSAILFILASVMMMVGCSKAVDIQLADTLSAYVISDSKTPIHLEKTDAAYIQLNDWLAENRTGWHNTAGRFPGGVYLLSGDTGIQVTGMNVVVYSTRGPEPEAQYIRHVGKLELSDVRALEENAIK